MGKETSINLFFFVVLKKMSNMFALSIFFLHMSTSFEWECFGVFTGTWRISIGDRSLYLASLAWTGLLFRAEIIWIFTCYISFQCSFNISSRFNVCIQKNPPWLPVPSNRAELPIQAFTTSRSHGQTNLKRLSWWPIFLFSHLLPKAN